MNTKSSKIIIGAIETGNINLFADSFKKIKNKCKTFNYGDNSGYSYLHLAAEKGSLEIVKSIFEIDPDFPINMHDGRGRSALQRAVVYSNISIVEFLLDRKASLEVGENIVPLLLSARRSIEVFNVLLEHGADIFKSFEGSPVAYEICTNCNSSAFIASMERKGLDVHKKFNGHYFLHYIIPYDQDIDIILEKVRYLLSRKIDVNLPDDDGNTAIFQAIGVENERCLELIKLLVENGARLDIINQSGYTPLDAAAMAEKNEIVEYLLSTGANFNSISRDELIEMGISVPFGKLKNETGNCYNYELHFMPVRKKHLGFLKNHFSDYRNSDGFKIISYNDSYTDKENKLSIYFKSLKYFKFQEEEPEDGSDRNPLNENIYYRLAGKDQFFSNIFNSDIYAKKLKVYFIDDTGTRWEALIDKNSDLKQSQ